jgi:hypothetical protein
VKHYQNKVWNAKNLSRHGYIPPLPSGFSYKQTNKYFRL